MYCFKQEVTFIVEMSNSLIVERRYINLLHCLDTPTMGRQEQCRKENPSQSLKDGSKVLKDLSKVTMKFTTKEDILLRSFSPSFTKKRYDYRKIF